MTALKLPFIIIIIVIIIAIFFFISRKKNTTAQGPEENTQTQLISTYNHFNIVKHGDRFVAANKSLGKLDFVNDHVGDRDLPPYVFVGKTDEDTTSKIENANQDPDVYTVTEFCGHYVAVSDTLSEKELLGKSYSEINLPPYIFSGNNEQQITELVEKTEKEMPKEPVIKLVSTKGNYNLIQCGDTYIAVEHAMGKIDFLKDTVGDRDLSPFIFIGKTRDEVVEKLKSAGLDLDDYSINETGNKYIAATEKVEDLIGKKYSEVKLTPYIYSSTDKDDVQEFIDDSE
ncbi:hypothetical protein P0136_08625 [Lentisphaerota bacterium ZTH]|nr:hypothetical protein JYG24_00270 [Lentisphaerota bacterium]WET05428.1 hypothetical protein P0136_08625 [Lentisphaerota bacterium ZTH]